MAQKTIPQITARFLYYLQSQNVLKSMSTVILLGGFNKYKLIHECQSGFRQNRPVARYGLPPPPPRGNFVDNDFLEA